MANPAKLGTELQVNTHTPDNQQDTSVTGLTDGGFVVVWESTPGQDTSGSGVYGQRYNADGAPAGVEFLINNHTLSHQSDCDVTALADGGVVVTWESYNQDAGVNDTGIFGQRFNANGTPNGVEFQINNETADNQADPRIATLADGGFVVTWSSEAQDGSLKGVYAQQYNADGTLNGGEFQVNSETVANQELPNISALADGGFVITWNSFNQDGSNFGVYGQRYNTDGTRNGVEFLINSFTVNNQQDSSVTGLENGGFVVTWMSYNQDAPGDLNQGVYGQRYNADGTRAGVEFQVNTDTVNNQQNPQITALADGGFVITWDSYDQDAGGADYGVYGQRYNADGSKNGTEFLINTETANDQDRPSISVLANGNIVVVWDSYDQDAGGTDNGVFAQLFSIDLFSAGDDMVYLPAIGPTGGWQALAGDDRVIGSDNADSVSGVAGDDHITAGLGNDNVDGGMGDDYITGGDGMDTIDGGDGSDYLYGQGGDDTINAGAGAMDVSLGDDGNDTINGEAGMDYMYGYAGNDTLRGGAGDDVAYGGTGNDELYGDEGADWLFGEAGNDKLFGGAGADLLMGGAGADEIIGGAGNDWMWGGDMTGAGDGAADTFFFAANWGGDVIWDFEDGKDMLDVSGAGITSFADLTIGTFSQFTTVTLTDDNIIYLRGAGVLAVTESDISAADFIFA